MRLIIFTLQDEIFACDASCVSRIVPSSGAGGSKYFQRSPEIHDVDEERVFDLRSFLFGCSLTREKAHAIKVEIREGESCVVLVEKINDVVEVTGEETYPIPAYIFSEHAEYFQGALLYKGTLAPLLDIKKLLSSGMKHCR